jgi:hypothetical protein
MRYTIGDCSINFDLMAYNKFNPIRNKHFHFKKTN